MKVLITGGTGFIGAQLAKRILSLGKLTSSAGKVEPVDEMVLFDVALPTKPIPGLDDKRVTIKAGNIADQKTIAALIDRPDISVFHLASIVSGEGEENFDLAMKVNLDGHLHLLEALRAQKSKPKIVFASSVAVFGGPTMPKTVSDATKQTPQTTYGMTKAMGEQLINDYTRKGFVDGRAARLPTVIVRPGKPNKAASSWASGVVREPLNGVDCILPVPLETQHPVACYRTIVEGFVKLHEADSAAIGPRPRLQPAQHDRVRGPGDRQPETRGRQSPSRRDHRAGRSLHHENRRRLAHRHECGSRHRAGPAQGPEPRFDHQGLYRGFRAGVRGPILFRHPGQAKRDPGSRVASRCVAPGFRPSALLRSE